MGVEAVATGVERFFRERADRYRLRADEVRTEPTLNWGGFVNLHFEVSDGDRAYHLKLSSDRDVLDGLRRWRALAPLLETRYRAPAIVDWVELPELDLSGLLFERSGGRHPDFRASAALLPDVLALVERLHDDEELSRLLRDEGVVADPRESVLRHYVSHLEADLAESGHRYPVAAPVLDWMMEELGDLRLAVERDRSFEGGRPVPIHDDLWKDNLLFEASGEWLVIDWDDLKIGDPVLDYATLLWPLLRDGEDPSPWLGRNAEDEGFRQRLELCRRAALLDEVIDSLADWVEAEKMPAHLEGVRAEKLRVHRRALEKYQRRYDRL